MLDHSYGLDGLRSDEAEFRVAYCRRSAASHRILMWSLSTSTMLTSIDGNSVHA